MTEYHKAYNFGGLHPEVISSDALEIKQKDPKVLAAILALLKEVATNIDIRKAIVGEKYGWVFEDQFDIKRIATVFNAGQGPQVWRIRPFASNGKLIVSKETSKYRIFYGLCHVKKEVLVLKIALREDPKCGDIYDTEHPVREQILRRASGLGLCDRGFGNA